MKNKKIWSIVIASVVFALIVMLDLVTKELIFANLTPNKGDSADVLPGFINFVHVENTGGPWGVFSKSTVGLVIVSAFIFALMLVFYILRVRQVKDKSSMWLAVSVGLVAGGCIGNMVDRIFLGFVRDFINFQFMEFPAFNFADVAICVGVVVFMVYFIFFYSKEEKHLKNAKKSQNDDKKDGENE